MTVGEWVTMIAAILAAVLTEYNRLRTKSQLEVIGKDTNGNLSALKAELALERHRVRVTEAAVPNPTTAVRPRG